MNGNRLRRLDALASGVTRELVVRHHTCVGVRGCGKMQSGSNQPCNAHDVVVSRDFRFPCSYLLSGGGLWSIGSSSSSSLLWVLDVRVVH